LIIGSLTQSRVTNDLLSFLKVLKLLLRIFYQLNFQDLHPKFEDNLKEWMSIHQHVFQLQIDLKLLGGQDLILFKCKGESMRCILLYVQKYKEDFQALIHTFSQEIWQMCTLTDQDSKFDKIVINAIKYFKQLVVWQDMRGYFTENFKTLVDVLIVPNLMIQQVDITKFKIEPQSYIDTFFDQADLNSRRHVTIDLLRCLSKNYKDQLLQYIQNIIPAYLGILQTQGCDQQQEITLLNLVIDSSLQAYRAIDGVTLLNFTPEVIDYVYQNIMKGTIGAIYQALSQNQQTLVESLFQPIFVSTYIRFIFYYRHYIPKNEILELIKFCSLCLQTQSQCLQQISCYTIEALFALQDGDLRDYTQPKKYFFSENNIEPQVEDILHNLSSYSQKLQDTEYYLLKALYQITKLLEKK
jgi:exportin-2 (importin alpha re-exporter)